MGQAKGPRKISRYTAEFKVKAVKLSDISGVLIQDVADALDIHRFMSDSHALQLKQAAWKYQPGQRVPSGHGPTEVEGRRRRPAFRFPDRRI